MGLGQAVKHAELSHTTIGLAGDLPISDKGAAVSGWHALRLGYIHICYCENFSEIEPGVGEIQQVKVSQPALVPRDYTKTMF